MKDLIKNVGGVETSLNDVYLTKEYNGQKFISKVKCELYNDHFENAKRYNIPHAQLIIADIPYNLGNNAYASNPMWYEGGDNKNGESKLANKTFFKTDENFKINNFFDFCTRYLKKEPKEPNQAPAMIVFCAFEQMNMVIEEGKKHGLVKSYPLIFIKNFSAQVLKANMKIVGATEYAVVLYRDKLPKFRNNGRMIFNWFEWVKDTKSEKIHPTQKPVPLLEKLIEIFTDEGDVVIDCCAGSGSTLIASRNLKRNSYGFEIEKEFYNKAIDWINGTSEEERKMKEKGITTIFDFLNE